MNRDNYKSDKQDNKGWNGNDHVSVVAQIRKNLTGQIVNYPTEILWSNETDSPYLSSWKIGNNSCDCNRAMFFDRVLGIEKEEPDEDNGENIYPCGEGDYSVNLVNPVTNEVFYKEY